MKDLETMLMWLERAAEDYGDDKSLWCVINNTKTRIKYYKEHGSAESK